jgi:hypothetical protein
MAYDSSLCVDFMIQAKPFSGGKRNQEKKNNCQIPYHCHLPSSHVWLLLRRQRNFFFLSVLRSGRERKSDNPIFWQEDYDDPYYSFPPRFFAILMFGLFPSIKKRPKRAVVEEMEWLFSLWSFFIDL